ncbi:MAG: hypothetical protein AAB262_06725 [Elusimicrobiota bacterium]
MNEAASERRLVGVVFISCLLLYLSFRSLYFNFDGIACATAVELSDFKHLVHGNHLVYGVLGWLFDQGWRLLGYGGRAILSLQVLDGILGAAAAAVFASILHRAGRGEREAALGAAALAVSQAWWFWSLEAQVYMLGALFAALSAREALADSPSPERLGLWHAGAVLGHVGHVMALPALIFILTRKRGWASVVPYGGVLAGAVLASYALAGVFAVRPQALAELWLWLVGSAALGPDRAFSWHAPTFVAAFPDWGRMTLRIFCDFVGSSGAVWCAGVILAALPLAAAVVGAVRGGLVGRFWILWLGGYAALYLTWEPATVVYRVSDLLALWALGQIAIARRPSWMRSGALAAWVAAAFAYNLIFLVRPSADPASNADLVEARWTGEHVPEDAWVLANSRGAIYLPYFMGLKPLNLRYFMAGDALFARLDALAKNGEAVYATDRTMEHVGVREALGRYGLEDAVSGEGLRLYRVRRKAGKREHHRYGKVKK